MKVSTWLKRSFVIVGSLALAIQFVPVSRTNPPVVKELTWDSPTTRAFAQRACFDCHSSETKWPWYSYVAPMSWLIASDVQEGRERLNLSEITDEDGAGSLIKRINNGSMPPPKYLALHNDARLTDAEKQQFIAGLRHSFGRLGTGSKETEKVQHKPETKP